MAKKNKMENSGKSEKSELDGKVSGDSDKRLNNSIVKKGNVVSLDYEGRLENGEIFDSSRHGDHSHPLEFEVGSGQVIPGFDGAVIGMKKGEEKEFSIQPSEAYGERRDELLRDFPKSMLPPGEEPEEGAMIVLGTPDGRQFPVKIEKVGTDTITLDLNHPLAGKKLIFKIKVLEVRN